MKVDVHWNEFRVMVIQWNGSFSTRPERKSAGVVFISILPPTGKAIPLEGESGEINYSETFFVGSDICGCHV